MEVQTRYGICKNVDLDQYFKEEDEDEEDD